MPAHLVQLTIFISSPSNLDPERRIIEKVADNLSNLFEKQSQPVRFKVIRWDVDIVPGVGPYSQDVINQTIEGKYDIYIGLLGMRFGTATPRAGSGTEEEFNTAYDLYARSPEKIRLLFYFKGWEDNIFQHSPEEFVKVICFREKLASQGVLFHDLKREADLPKLIEAHLLQLVSDDWNGESWRSRTAISIAPNARQQSVQQADDFADVEESDELGLVDVIIMVNEASEALSLHFNRMGVAAKTFTEVLSERVKEKEIAENSGDLRLVKHVLDNVARDLDQYTVQFTAEATAFGLASQTILDSMGRLVKLHFDEGTGNRDDLTTLLPSFEELTPSLESVREGIISLKGNVSRMQNMTTATKRAKKRLIAAIDDYAASVLIYTTTARDLAENLKMRLLSS